MHPLLRDPRRLAIYLVMWAVIGTLFASLVAVIRHVPLSAAALVIIPLTLVDGLICLSAWWIVRGSDRSSMLELTQRTVSSSIQASAVWAGISTPWLVLMSNMGVLRLATGEVFLGAAGLFAVGVPLYGVSMGIHYLVRVVESAREAERRVLESQVATREAQLRALRAQLNPHFLFNSLNSINALVGTDPEAARRMCESLGDFLRRTLALGARESVTLEEELSLVERYFAIERVRFGERLGVERAIERGAERCLVPPLLLQPLVENAVKHGIAERLQGGTVKITAAVKEGALRLSVENEVDDDTVTKPGQGVGLENVRRRLDVVSARDARLDTARENGTFRVTLTLPARSAPETETEAHGG
jgi:sensor histidine kinase YesM